MAHKSSIVVCVLVGFSLVAAAWRVLAASFQWRARSLVPPVDYIDINYLSYLPVPPSDPVALSLHESARFSLAQNDTLGDLEWKSILTYAQKGRVQFGVQQRAFMPAYFHQFHCLRGLQRSIVFPGDRSDVNVIKAPDVHVHHCLNYLRQLFICVAADSLERGDFTDSNFEEGALGDDLVCHDWENVFGEMDRKYDEFKEWNAQWN